MSALLCVALCGSLAASPAATAGGKPAKGKPPKGPPEKPAEKLPAGCTRLADGYGASVSPDGKWIAYARAGAIPRMYAKQSRDRLELQVRETKTDAGWALPQTARPVGWAGDTLLLDTGIGVEPVKGARAGKTASLPAGASSAEVAWTRDGRRLAWAPASPGNARTVVHVVGIDGKVATLAGTEGLRTDQTVLLGWSPDGARLYVNGLFQGEKGAPCDGSG